MKILQVTHRYPPRAGGVETHVRRVSEELVSRGHEVTVVTADAGADVSRRERRNGVRIRRCRGVAPGGAFHFAPGVARVVRNAVAEIDVVHAHNYHSFPLALAALGGGSRPFVATPHYHGSSADDVRDKLLELYRPIGGTALRRADEVIAVSEWEKAQLKSDFGVDATVIPNGLDVARFENATPCERSRPYLLTVGRLVEYKGVQHAIRALSDLPEYDLLVAGSGSYREGLERLAREIGVVERVEFLGYVDDDELPNLYAGAAAYLTLSTHEAYGMTVAESLAAGTPALVREAGALVDWADRADCLGVSAVDSGTVAEAVRRVVELDAPATPLPTWTEVVDALESKYRALLSSDAESRP
ncbi:glycosyl transferase [Haloprofundus marisrubri]|uniref:Glycosyl transferase n=1 Tax=Haloprofundus marisrubri TaxID=1514971 RepID=A0A0W1RAF6_9EURY|nr:glycosyltransferase family 4 protein [Haloprofundus marisrubri]KTG10444.1 glycosyl transferase [Haloprofundus marisrubri]